MGLICNKGGAIAKSELGSGAGEIPAALGEGLKHFPHGSDWSSIRDAGMKEDKLEAESGDAASIDGYGYEQEGNETVVRLSLRNRLTRKSQKAKDIGPASLDTTGIHPRRNPAEFVTLSSSENRSQERSNSMRALCGGSSKQSRCQPDGAWTRIESEANACL